MTYDMTSLLSSDKIVPSSLYIELRFAETEVPMGVLSNVKAEPTDPIRGMFNDVVDTVGFPRPEEALGTPADVVHLAGLPTVKDALPQPIDVWSRMSRSLRSGGGPFPRMPTPPPLPRLESLLPLPGESGPEADSGQDVAAAATGAENVPPMRQRYYQKPPFFPPGFP